MTDLLIIEGVVFLMIGAPLAACIWYLNRVQRTFRNGSRIKVTLDQVIKRTVRAQHSTVDCYEGFGTDPDGQSFKIPVSKHKQAGDRIDVIKDPETGHIANPKDATKWIIIPLTAVLMIFFIFVQYLILTTLVL